jgi:Leucine-rich repeat (LRR) protein
MHSAQTLPKLLTLDVSANQLKFLPDFSIWSPLVGSVTASHNRIRSWPSSLRAPLLRELYLNGNAIDVFGPVGFLPLLCFLDLSDNHITCIEWVGGCPLLCTLLLSRNEIAAFSALRPLATLRELRVLRLDGNPVASSMLYPNSLHDICPTLEQIDGNPFEPDQYCSNTPIIISPSYVTYWLNDTSASLPPPVDKETPVWWNFCTLLKLCKKLALDAAEITTRYIPCSSICSY